MSGDPGFDSPSGVIGGVAGFLAGTALATVYWRSPKNRLNCDRPLVQSVLLMWLICPAVGFVILILVAFAAYGVSTLLPAPPPWLMTGPCAAVIGVVGNVQLRLMLQVAKRLANWLGIK